MPKNQIFLLLAIKTASTLQKERVQISLSKASIPFLVTLYKHGLIQNFLLSGPLVTLKKKIQILIYLRYFFNKPICKNLKILSKPSLTLCLTFTDICLIYDKRHTIFLSTSSGILTNLECKKKKIGGITLFKC